MHLVNCVPGALGATCIAEEVCITQGQRQPSAVLADMDGRLLEPPCHLLLGRRTWLWTPAGARVIFSSSLHSHPDPCPPPAAPQVIPPEEINVSFDDIGALEAVKNTLHEVRRS